MQNAKGKIPLHQCQGVIKAISKKKVEKFKKYQDDFIKNAQTTLNISEEQAKEKWAELESFAGYGFNLCMTTGTLIPSKESDGVYVNKEIQNFISGDVVLCVDEEGNTVETKVLALHYHGLLEGYKVLFDDAYILNALVPPLADPFFERVAVEGRFTTQSIWHCLTSSP
jgi:hypothetical protein